MYQKTLPELGHPSLLCLQISPDPSTLSPSSHSRSQPELIFCTNVAWLRKLLRQMWPILSRWLKLYAGSIYRISDCCFALKTDSKWKRIFNLCSSGKEILYLGVGNNLIFKKSAEKSCWGILGSTCWGVPAPLHVPTWC